MKSVDWQGYSTKGIYGAILLIVVWTSLVALNKQDMQIFPAGPALNELCDVANQQNCPSSNLKSIAQKQDPNIKQLNDKTYVLTSAEIVGAYRVYGPKVNSAEGFMDLLEGLHRYSSERIIKETAAEEIVASGQDLSVAMDKLDIDSDLPVGEISNIVLTKTKDPSIMLFDLKFYGPISPGSNYLVVKLKLYFPKESSWSIQNVGDLWVFKNIEGKPSLNGRFFFTRFEVNNIREVGKFPHKGKFFGYFIGEVKQDMNSFGGIDIAPFSIGNVASIAFKGSKKFPSEVPSFSELNSLLA